MRICSIYILFFLYSCGSNDMMSDPTTLEEEQEMMDVGNENHAIVTQITVTGEENAYIFNVTLSSPDTGCDQYANWWEIFDEEEELQYRRILTHSHINEQPFTRSGGPVPILKDQKVYIRGHMNNTGYGLQVFSGTVEDGFFEGERVVSIDLEKTDPQPDGCDF